MLFPKHILVFLDGYKFIKVSFHAINGHNKK